MKTFKVGNKVLGSEDQLYFVADIGANHDGSLERAYRLIELAKEAGADAAKFQNFKANKIVSKKGFQDLGGQLSHQANWKKSVFEVYEDASLNDDWTPLLKAKCDSVGIDYFTSAYDFEGVDHAFPFVDMYKIGSGDITWTEIIQYTASKGKPVLIATGASEMEDVDRAMEILSNATCPVVLMQCNTNYTTSPDKYKYVNLNVLKSFRQKYPESILGLSDHTFGHATVLGALAFGARVFEKHFTDDNRREGPDHKFAMNPETWKEMVDNAYQLLNALGDGIKRIEKNEHEAIVVQRRALHYTCDLPKGKALESSDIFALRPCPSGSVPPYRKPDLLGKTLLRDVRNGELVDLNDIKL